MLQPEALLFYYMYSQFIKFVFHTSLFTYNCGSRLCLKLMDIFKLSFSIDSQLYCILDKFDFKIRIYSYSVCTCTVEFFSY